MASDPPKSPAASGSKDTTMSDSPPKYVPQFSAATEMILKRINSGATTSLSSMGITGTPPGYEDMRRSVLQNMKTTMNMEIPTTPIGNNRGRTARAAGSANASRTSATPTGTGSGKGKAAAKPKGRAGTKRKRVKDESESTEGSESDMSKLGGDDDSDSEEESVEVMPKITQSGRQVVKPTQFVPAAYENPAKRRAPSKKSQEHALCKRCGRGHSPQNNMIVFCDGCNLPWHQMCHDPIIGEDVLKDEESQWFCAECSLKRGIKPREESPKGMSWEGRSAEEKRAYLTSLPHQQLVSLLMQSTVLYPSLPIFPPTNTFQPTIPKAPLPSPAPVSSYQKPLNVYPQQPFPPSAAAGLFARAEANPNATMNFIRKITPAAGSPTPTTAPPPVVAQPTFTHAASAPPTLAAQTNSDSRESTPPSPPYPKPGNGLMARLGPDEEDLEWLVDNSDFDAFSHVVYDEHGEKAEENGVPVGA